MLDISSIGQAPDMYTSNGIKRWSLSNNYGDVVDKIAHIRYDKNNPIRQEYGISALEQHHCSDGRMWYELAGDTFNGRPFSLVVSDVSEEGSFGEKFAAIREALKETRDMVVSDSDIFVMQNTGPSTKVDGMNRNPDIFVRGGQRIWNSSKDIGGIKDVSQITEYPENSLMSGLYGIKIKEQHWYDDGREWFKFIGTTFEDRPFSIMLSNTVVKEPLIKCVTQVLNFLERTRNMSVTDSMVRIAKSLKPIVQ